MTRAERVQKIAETIAAYEAARDRLDRMTRVKFQICFKIPPDELADARRLAQEMSRDPNDRRG